MAIFKKVPRGRQLSSVPTQHSRPHTRQTRQEETRITEPEQQPEAEEEEETKQQLEAEEEKEEEEGGEEEEDEEEKQAPVDDDDVDGSMDLLLNDIEEINDGINIEMIPGDAHTNEQGPTDGQNVFSDRQPQSTTAADNVIQQNNRQFQDEREQICK